MTADLPIVLAYCSTHRSSPEVARLPCCLPAGQRRSLPAAQLLIQSCLHTWLAGTGKLQHIARQCSSAVVGIDWAIDMAEARTQLGTSRVLQGNVDPMVLMGPQSEIKSAVDACLQGSAAEGTRGRHILNVGHGVAQGTPPDNVAYFCELARETEGLVAERREAPALVA